MSATLNFHIEAASPAPVVDGPYGAMFDWPGQMCVRFEAGNTKLNLFASDDQLAAIAKAILAHLEKQEAGDFETEVA